MRRAYNSSVWRDDQLNIIAINLGADYCAEHEWGIDGIKRRFGITPQKSGILSQLIGSDKIGIDARTITQSPDSLVQFDTKVETYIDRKKGSKHLFGLGTLSEYRTSSDPQKEFDHYVKSSHFDPQREEALGFWAESRFMFLTESQRDVNEIAEAFKQKDVAIWVGASGPFKNGGLILAIVSRLPEEFKKEMLEADQDRIELKKAAESTGIHSILKEAKCEYYALSPRWKDESKKEIMFWLNPQEQRKHNSGWYDVATLKQWAKGEGPIIKETVKA